MSENCQIALKYVSEKNVGTVRYNIAKKTIFNAAIIK